MVRHIGCIHILLSFAVVIPRRTTPEPNKAGQSSGSVAWGQSVACDRFPGGGKSGNQQASVLRTLKPQISGSSHHELPYRTNSRCRIRFSAERSSERVQCSMLSSRDAPLVVRRRCQRFIVVGIAKTKLEPTGGSSRRYLFAVHHIAHHPTSITQR